ncbi:ParA family protein (plasmid) [Sphaerotilaceae bacterium SBD11-9]
MRVLAVANQKGGVGKSTLTAHLAYAAEEAKLRVLLVDFDKQGSLSLSFPPVNGAAPGLPASALFSSAELEQEPEVLSERMAIIRADDTLSLLSGGTAGAEKRPAAHLRKFAAQYDLCLIDTPGAIGFNPPMTVGALVAADAVVCPFSVGLYEAKGLQDLWAYLKSIKTPAYNPRLRLMGLLPSKINTKSREERNALEELRATFGSVILPGMLAERTAVKQSIMRRRPVWKGTKGAGHMAAAKEWRTVCNYVLGNLGGVAK